VADLLVDQLKLMASSVPGATAFKDLDGGELTFARWDSQANRLGRGLADAGVVKGDRVAIYLPAVEALDWVVSYAAVHRAGAVAVPTNTRLVASELAAVLGHADVSVIVTSAQLGSVLDPVPVAPPPRPTTGRPGEGCRS
jgi:acyl-CoA synthetase (AMP-forming)/AMP-acid ligase II